MRYPFLYLVLLLPQVAAAQFIRSFELGSYVLRAEPRVSHQAGLYLPSGQQLLVRDLTGQTQALTPTQVSSFQLAGRRFVTTGGFVVRDGGLATTVAQGFAEQLDSGRVVLLRYSSLTTEAPGMGSSGAVVYGGPATGTVYLLHPGGQPAALTTVQGIWSRRNPQLRAALRPYLATRPDLLQLLEAKRLAPEQLPLVVRALNSGQPLGNAPR